MGFFGGINRTGFLLLGGGLIVASLWGFFFGFKKTPKEPLPSMEEWADLALSGVSFVQSKSGVKEWELQAAHSQLFENEQTALLKNIMVKIKTQNGATLTVSGDSGAMDMAGKTFSIQNDKEPVSITWGNAYTIKTSKLRWSSDERVIQTDGEVMITGAGISIRGDRLKIFLDRSELTVFGGVHAEVY